MQNSKTGNTPLSVAAQILQHTQTLLTPNHPLRKSMPTYFPTHTLNSALGQTLRSFWTRPLTCPQPQYVTTKPDTQKTLCQLILPLPHCWG